ncbi:MAG: PAS domain S-box protein [Rhodospirillales bacterium]|nr:PAS domain S-box protein [Rhodospirillales bacterium]
MQSLEEQAADATPRSIAFLWFLALTLTALVFVFDLQIPLGVAAGVPYVAVILVGWWLPNRHSIMVLAAVCSLLTIIGYTLSPAGGIPWMVATNRFLALFAIWTAAVLLSKVKESSEQLTHSRNELKSQVEKRTKELSERITAQECVEDALSESVVRLRNVLETASDLFWEMDKNFCLTKITDYPGVRPLPGKEKFIGKTRWDAAGGDPEKEDKWRQHRGDHLAHRSYRDFEFSVTDKNGDVHFLSVSGIPVFTDDGIFNGYRGSASNITPRMLAETELMESKARFESIVELAADAIISLDKDHQIIFFNTAAERMFGIQREEAIGQTLDRFLPEDKIERHRELVEQFAKSRVETINMGERPEVTARRANGEIFPVEASLSRRETPNGLVLTIMMRDITERMRAEESLRESEERFRAIVNTSPAGITLKDFEGRYLMVNDTFASWMEMDVSEILDKRPAELYPDEHALAGLKNDREVFLGGKTHVTEDTRKFRDGVLRNVITHKCPIRSRNGEIVATSTIITDITDYKRAEGAFRESEAKLRAIFDNTPVCLNLKDTDGRYMLVNKPYEEWLGRPADEIIGKTIIEVLEGLPEAEDSASAERMVMETGTPFESEVTIQRPDGKTYHRIQIKFPVKTAEGEISGIGTVALDITDRKRAERELQESEAKFRDIAEASSDFFWELDEDLRFTFISGSAAWHESQQFPGGDLIGKTRWEAIGIDPEKDEYWRKHVEGMKAHKPFRDFPASYPDKNGRQKHWHVSGIPVFGAEGKFQGYRGSSTEITLQVEAEEDRNRALIQAEEANQAKSEFLATMSHELRTPLNAILGFSEVLINQYFGPLGGDKYEEYANNIFVSGGYLLGLVNNLLDISRIEAGEYQLSKKMVDLRELVNECYQASAQRANEAGITLQKRCPVQLPPLYADNLALKQILLNLLTNAVKFTPNGGKITVSASNKGDIYTIKITDTGAGIPKEDLWKLTHPFEKGKYDPYVTNDGAGLGLAITQSLVDLHNGELDIKSKVGRGTTVTVTLPNQAP